jgi:uncharacterized protein (TIGR02099 family)
VSGSWRRRHAHQLARAAGWTAGVAVIVLAVLVALGQLLLPLLARHPQWVAAQLGEQLHRPVSFASMEGRWQASGPQFILRDVTIGTPGGGSSLRLPQSELKLDFGGWLLPSRHLLNLRVRGLQLDLSHDRAGRWHVNGVGVAGGGESQPVSLGPLSVGVQLDDLHVLVDDAATGRRYRLLADQLRLSRQGTRIRVGVLLRREGAAGRWRGAGSFRDDGSSGQLWLSGEQADLPALLGDVAMDGYVARRGRGNLSVWLDWKQGRIARSTVRFDVDGLALANDEGITVEIPALRGLASLDRSGDGYAFRWAGDDGSALVATLHQPGTEQMRVGVAARNLQVAPLLPWLALKPGMSPRLAQWLGSGRPRGIVDHASLQWSRVGGLQQANIAFRDLHIGAVGALPGVAGVRGELRGDGQALSLQLPPQATVVSDPERFRQPLALKRFAGTFALWRADAAWHIGAEPIEFAGTGFAGQARGEVALPDGGGAPFVELYAQVDHAEVTAAKAFLPRSMSPAALHWLDRGLVAGHVAGSMLLRGSLADWPFRDNDGRFEAHAGLSGLTLDYGDGWPRAEGIDAQASFVGNGLLAEASAGQSLGVKVNRAVALIPDFSDALLDLNVQGEGSGGSLLDFVQHSPIARRQASTLSRLHLGGKGNFDFHLALPLHDASQLVVNGTARLQDADLDAPEWNLELDRLTGPLAFDAHGLHAGPLAGGFRGQPSTLDLAIADATGKPDDVLTARLTGRYSLAELIQGHAALDWLAAAAAGRSDFSVAYDLSHPNGGDALAQTLSIDSSLAGIGLDLPAPLDKPAGSALPLHLTMALPLAGSDLQVAVGDLLRARLRLPPTEGQPLAGTIALGSRMPDALPDKGLRIRGQAAQLDATGWLQHAVAGSAGGGPGLESIDVTADRARVFEHDFAHMRIQADPQVDALGIDVNGPGMLGHFTVPTVDLRKRGVTARLQRLYWPKGDTPPSGAAVASPSAAHAPLPVAAPASASTSPSPLPPAEPAAPAKATAAATDDPAATGIDPAALPPLHLWIADLRLGDAKLGEARLETWPTAKGMHIDQLRALSRRVQITASGNWEGTAASSHTHLHIDFAAENVGSLLGALGFTGLFEGGKTQAQLDAGWPGAPSALALATMDGTLSVNLTHGRIPEVGAGVGRLFGLVSVAELPRRLTLDFGDVFGKGLAFDAITGDFRLADGNATTDNLKIVGPAAEIGITGRTGLRAHDYDQEVWVVPHLGSGLPVVGAVVAGPVGAAAGFAVQGLLGKGLNKAASARYRVTGTWDKPVFTLLEKHGLSPKAPSAQPQPAPAATSAPPPAPAPAASAPRSPIGHP